MEKGIDISKYQKSIDLTNFKKFGYSFITLKIGQYNTGKDSSFESHYKKASALNIPIGVYYFAKPNQTAKEAINQIKTWLNGKKVDYIALDMEADLAKTSLKNFNTNLYLEFSKLVNSEFGIPSLLYASESFLKSMIDVSQIKDYLWVAKYSSKQPAVPNGKIGMWQYTSSADTSDFYKSPLDRSKALVPYSEIVKKAENTSAVNTRVVPNYKVGTKYTVVNCTSLNVRTKLTSEPVSAIPNGKILCSLKKGDRVTCQGLVNYNGKVYFYIGKLSDGREKYCCADNGKTTYIQ